MPILAMPGVQKALTTKLGSSITVDGVAVAVVANAKPDQPMPYVLIGPASERRANTHDAYNAVVIQPIEVYTGGTEAQPFYQCKAIMSSLANTLDGATLTLPANSGTFRACHIPEQVEATCAPEGDSMNEVVRGALTLEITVDILP